MVTASFEADRAHYLLMLRILVSIAASGEGKSVSEYARLVGVSKSVIIRYLLDMHARTPRGAPGLGLVEARKVSLDQATVQEIHLTSKGRENVSHAMAGGLHRQHVRIEFPEHTRLALGVGLVPNSTPMMRSSSA